MPRYKVVERRCYEATYVVDADNEDDAKRLRGSANIVSEDGDGGDSYGDELLSCEEIDEDDEE